MGPFKDTPDGVVLLTHVQPKAARNAIVGYHGDRLKISLTSPPVDNAANEALKSFLADLFQIRKGAVAITAGWKSRRKTVRIEGLTLEALTRIVENALGERGQA
jgi:uncharacterized protein (TIGR00251 family)